MVDFLTGNETPNGSVLTCGFCALLKKRIVSNLSISVETATSRDSIISYTLTPVYSL